MSPTLERDPILKSIVKICRDSDAKYVGIFGSYARGEETDYSDVDVVIVAKTFKSIPFEKRLDVLYQLTADLYPDFHVFGYTPQEFQNVSSLSTIAEAKTQGIPLL